MGKFFDTHRPQVIGAGIGAGMGAGLGALNSDDIEDLVSKAPAKVATNANQHI